MKNEFYYKLLNIGKGDEDIDLYLHDIVKRVVKESKKGNDNLDRLCKVVANNIAVELKKKQIDYRVISLYDYDLYDHVVILARTMNDNKLEYYLIDPTFIQFRNDFIFNKLEELDVYLLGRLVEEGYSKLNNNEFNLYFKSFGYDGKELDMNDVFLELKRKRK